MAHAGERLGGDNLTFTASKPLRIIIGGPPHSGKSTLMNLLEDKFRYYQIAVELIDLDLSAPTPLKTGFTEEREKRDWTIPLAERAKEMFEENTSVEVILGDSVGLISDVNEIISQPADVAILLVSGGHGDYDDTYKKVVRKWKEYYEDIHKPLLVVLRSSMNPKDESMFDPQHNYGVVVGLDRDAYLTDVINMDNAALEGVVFEIAQSFDLILRSPNSSEHLEILNSKWPDLKDKKTWTPPEGSKLGGIERAYFEERGRVPADQRAESLRGNYEDFFDELDRVVSYEDLENAPICPTCNEQVKIRMTGEKSPWASCRCNPDPHPDAESFGAEYARGYRLKTNPRSSPRASSLDSRTRRNISKNASLTPAILGSIAVFGTGLWLLSNRDSEIKET